jgi:hypothetical protein
MALLQRQKRSRPSGAVTQATGRPGIDGQSEVTLQVRRQTPSEDFPLVRKQRRPSGQSPASVSAVTLVSAQRRTQKPTPDEDDDVQAAGAGQGSEREQACVGSPDFPAPDALSPNDGALPAFSPKEGPLPAFSPNEGPTAPLPNALGPPGVPPKELLRPSPPSSLLHAMVQASENRASTSCTRMDVRSPRVGGAQKK